MPNHSQPLDSLTFDNRFVNELPGDPEPDNFCRQVSEACYSQVQPTPAIKPVQVSYSHEVAAMLGLDQAACESDQFLQVFSGSQLLPGMQPYAQCYGGHQFGNWAGQLGDGRAINLGEVVTPANGHLTLQLKGAGLTPYSRNADGRAVLRSSVREFLCSEAMHHLGVPTTRALSLHLTGRKVMRDMLYDGNPRNEAGAVVCRVAPSFTRFGNFQIFAARHDLTQLKTLLDFTLRNDFPHVGAPSKESYLAWFNEVCRRTAEMVAHWQRVGFVHGVMNTDNMSILGLTIDYGPYGWLEDYDPDWTPNTTDAANGRYRFGQQPAIARWNLVQLANAIYPLIEDAEPLEAAIAGYNHHFENQWQAMITAKLGLASYQTDTDEALVDELYQVLQLVETDMTIFFRSLAKVNSENRPIETRTDDQLIEPLREAYYQPQQLTKAVQQRIAGWLRGYLKRVADDGISDSDRVQRMNSVNPKYVLRNYLAQLAIDQAEEGDFSKVNQLLDVLRRPYDEQPEQQQLAEKRPDWARNRAGCSMLSCSS